MKNVVVAGSGWVYFGCAHYPQLCLSSPHSLFSCRSICHKPPFQPHIPYPRRTFVRTMKLPPPSLLSLLIALSPLTPLIHSTPIPTTILLTPAASPASQENSPSSTISIEALHEACLHRSIYFRTSDAVGCRVWFEHETSTQSTSTGRGEEVAVLREYMAPLATRVRVVFTASSRQGGELRVLERGFFLPTGWHELKRR